MPMTFIWGAVLIVFLIVEAATAGLTCIWFALGALCALISALLGAPWWLQVIWFVIISAATLIITRPLAKKYINSRSQPTNADRIIGQTCRVHETIDNLANSGTVFADGKVWAARAADGAVIAADTVVTVKAIEGVKLIVTPAEGT